MGTLKKVTLDNVAGGVLPALFERALDELLLDVYDVNAAPAAVRSITIELKFKPQEDREVAEVTASVRSKLAGPRPRRASIWLAKEKGQLLALTSDPSQQTLDFPKPELVAEANREEDAE